jgi:hypothetical protein
MRKGLEPQAASSRDSASTLWRFGLPAAQARRDEAPVDWSKQEPGSPRPKEQLIDVAAADCLEQLDRFAQPVEPQCEENHFFLLPTLFIYR